VAPDKAFPAYVVGEVEAGHGRVADGIGAE
jgi:hypothetical protein